MNSRNRPTPQILLGMSLAFFCLGFAELFKEAPGGDPDFIAVRKAFAAIKCPGADAAFDDAWTAFPDGKPPRDKAERLKLYHQKFPGEKTSCDQKYLAAARDVEVKLAEYIKAHDEDFRDLPRPVLPLGEKK